MWGIVRSMRWVAPLVFVVLATAGTLAYIHRAQTVADAPQNELATTTSQTDPEGRVARIIHFAGANGGHFGVFLNCCTDNLDVTGWTIKAKKTGATYELSQLGGADLGVQ